MSDEKRWCPDFCPITFRPFFMWIEHPKLGMVPTYGGPYDSYTIPEPDLEGLPKRHDVEFYSYRYDHDFGGWVDMENCCLRVISEEMLIDLGVWGDD